jgi:hypothetical protein
MLQAVERIGHVMIFNKHDIAVLFAFNAASVPNMPDAHTQL